MQNQNKAVIQVYLTLSLGSTLNQYPSVIKKLKYQNSTTETTLQRQILFHSVAISHHNELSIRDIHNNLLSLITPPDWHK